MAAKMIEVRKIQWKWCVPDPAAFSCLICEHRQATHRVAIDSDGVMIKLHVCGHCIPWAGRWLEIRRPVPAVSESARILCTLAGATARRSNEGN